MLVNPISAAAPTPQPTTSEDSSQVLSSDFETFLTMLTTQMQNQDPLNPTDSEALALQLATFSGVEQQVRTNELLEGLGAGGALGEAGAWIGREVRHSGPVAWDGTPVPISWTPADGPGELVIRSAAGVEVGRMPASLANGEADWVATGPGGPLPHGTYTLTIEQPGPDGTSVAPVQSYAQVEEVRLVDGRAVLILEGGGELDPAEATALRG